MRPPRYDQRHRVAVGVHRLAVLDDQYSDHLAAPPRWKLKEITVHKAALDVQLPHTFIAPAGAEWRHWRERGQTDQSFSVDLEVLESFVHKTVAKNG